MQGTEPSLGPSPLCTRMLTCYLLLSGSVDEGEEDMISQQTSLALRCHLGGLPNYQQRTWKKIFNLLTFNKSMFPKAGPCTPSALSGLQPSPHVSTLCQKGPPRGVLIVGGKVHRLPWWDPLCLLSAQAGPRGKIQPPRPESSEEQPGMILNPFHVSLCTRVFSLCHVMKRTEKH